jgi:hypothetical protein
LLVAVSSLGVKFALFAAAVMALWATVLDVTTVRALLVAVVSGVLTAGGTIVANRQQETRAREIEQHVKRVETKVDGVQGTVGEIQTKVTPDAQADA